MSKRGEKTTSNEGSPRPCLVARDQRSEEISSRSLGSLVSDERKEPTELLKFRCDWLFDRISDERKYWRHSDQRKFLK